MSETVQPLDSLSGDCQSAILSDQALGAVLVRAIDGICDQIILFDPLRLTILHANRAVSERFGYKLGALLGKPLSTLLVAGPPVTGGEGGSLNAALERAADNTANQILTGAQSFTGALKGHDGACVPAELSLALMDVEPEGRTLGVLIGRLPVDGGNMGGGPGHGAGGTGIISLEAGTMDGPDLRERSRSNLDLEQFAFAISHDLKAPLRQIKAFSELIERRDGEALSDSGREFLSYIQAGTARMGEMIDSLLDFCRVQKPVVVGTVKLSQAVQDAISNLHQDIKRSGAWISGYETLPSVPGERALLSMLFQNTIANAIQYCGDQRPHITFDAVEHGPVLRISITDDGPGIAVQHADAIFDIFRRLQSGKDREGTGIGLAICRRVAELHGGQIWLDTDYQQGARFLLELPLGSGQR